MGNSSSQIQSSTPLPPEAHALTPRIDEPMDAGSANGFTAMNKRKAVEETMQSDDEIPARKRQRVGEEVEKSARKARKNRLSVEAQKLAQSNAEFGKGRERKDEEVGIGSPEEDKTGKKRRVRKAATVEEQEVGDSQVDMAESTHTQQVPDAGSFVSNTQSTVEPATQASLSQPAKAKRKRPHGRPSGLNLAPAKTPEPTVEGEDSTKNDLETLQETQDVLEEKDAVPAATPKLKEYKQRVRGQPDSVAAAQESDRAVAPNTQDRKKSKARRESIIGADGARVNAIGRPGPRKRKKRDSTAVETNEEIVPDSQGLQHAIRETGKDRGPETTLPTPPAGTQTRSEDEHTSLNHANDEVPDSPPQDRDSEGLRNGDHQANGTTYGHNENAADASISHKAHSKKNASKPKVQADTHEDNDSPPEQKLGEKQRKRTADGDNETDRHIPMPDGEMGDGNHTNERAGDDMNSTLRNQVDGGDIERNLEDTTDEKRAWKAARKEAKKQRRAARRAEAESKANGIDGHADTHMSEAPPHSATAEPAAKIPTEPREAVRAVDDPPDESEEAVPSVKEEAAAQDKQVKPKRSANAVKDSSFQLSAATPLTQKRKQKAPKQEPDADYPDSPDRGDLVQLGEPATTPAPSRPAKTSRTSKSTNLAKGTFTNAEKDAVDAVYTRLLRESGETQPAFNDTIASWRTATAFKAAVQDALPNRPLVALRKFCQRRYHNFERGLWSAEENEALKTAHAEFGDKWTEVSARVGRTAADCKDRWKNSVSLGDTVVLGPWSREEEQRLVEVVDEAVEKLAEDLRKNGEEVPGRRELEHVLSWVAVAEKFGKGRSAKRCNEKWQKMRHRGGDLKLASSAPQVLDTGLDPATRSKKVRAIERKFSQCSEGDLYDILTEIHTAIPDHAARYGDESTLWSAVSLAHQKSRFPSALRRRGFWEARRRYGETAGLPGGEALGDWTIAQAAEALADVLGAEFEDAELEERRTFRPRERTREKRKERGGEAKVVKSAEKVSASEDEDEADEERDFEQMDVDQSEDVDGEGEEEGKGDEIVVADSQPTPRTAPIENYDDDAEDTAPSPSFDSDAEPARPTKLSPVEFAKRLRNDRAGKERVGRGLKKKGGAWRA